MALAVFTTPPEGAKAYVRAEMILSLDPPFDWGKGAPARTLHLTSGARLLVEDTDDNVQVAVAAMGGEDVVAAVLVDAQDARARVVGVEKREG